MWEQQEQHVATEVGLEEEEQEGQSSGGEEGEGEEGGGEGSAAEGMHVPPTRKRGRPPRTSDPGPGALPGKKPRLQIQDHELRWVEGAKGGRNCHVCRKNPNLPRAQVQWRCDTCYNMSKRQGCWMHPWCFMLHPQHRTLHELEQGTTP